VKKTGVTKTAGVIVPAVILTALLAASSEARDFQGSIPAHKSQRARWHKMAGISIFRAVEIALSGFKGTPVEAELEVRDGFLVYEVGLSTGGSAMTEVVIDAGNGSLLKSEQEEDGEDEDDRAEDHEDDKAKDHPHGRTKVSLNDALKAALSAKSGTAVKAELERENGHLVYDIEIVDAGDKTFKVEIDAEAGKVRKINGD
jgi:uncharacterized membrane protein YkoI